MGDGTKETLVVLTAWFTPKRSQLTSLGVRWVIWSQKRPPIHLGMKDNEQKGQRGKERGYLCLHSKRNKGQINETETGKRLLAKVSSRFSFFSFLSFSINSLRDFRLRIFCISLLTIAGFVSDDRDRIWRERGNSWITGVFRGNKISLSPFNTFSQWSRMGCGIQTQTFQTCLLAASSDPLMWQRRQLNIQKNEWVWERESSPWVNSTSV